MSYQHATSGEAYKAIKNHLNKKEEEVYNAIKALCKEHGSCNDRMIREYLQWPINSAARRNALAEKEFIYEAEKKIDPVTNKKSIYWKVAEKQLTMFQ